MLIKEADDKQPALEELQKLLERPRVLFIVGYTFCEFVDRRFLFLLILNIVNACCALWTYSFAWFEFAKPFLLLFFVAFSWFPFFEHFFDHILFQFFFGHFWRCAGRYVGQWTRWLRGCSGGTFCFCFFFGQQWGEWGGGGWCGGGWCGGGWCSSTANVFTGKTIVFACRKLFFSATFAFAVAGSSLGNDGVTR